MAEQAAPSESSEDGGHDHGGSSLETVVHPPPGQQNSGWLIETGIKKGTSSEGHPAGLQVIQSSSRAIDRTCHRFPRPVSGRASAFGRSAWQAHFASFHRSGSPRWQG
ncbi:hypothetical protein S40285_10252 [Stachybotrys chlorohalonatus IBT 40285]|uniref:Uncharacterized protein n=1 Tax=Stachybotrys chlorohalonatus (strain IBT 40285) TaxID=1283841 RepID=A0A084QP73_STAC4|nr:hypothetical protein S40285_10252 [Stachybotrys chlorohalonata IBT 40285]